MQEDKKTTIIQLNSERLCINKQVCEVQFMDILKGDIYVGHTETID